MMYAPYKKISFRTVAWFYPDQVMYRINDGRMSDLSFFNNRSSNAIKLGFFLEHDENRVEFSAYYFTREYKWARYDVDFIVYNTIANLLKNPEEKENFEFGLSLLCGKIQTERKDLRIPYAS